MMFFLGIRYFLSSFMHFKSKIPLLLTIIGLSISLGCLIASIALMRGFQTETMSKILHVHSHAKIYNHNFQHILKSSIHLNKYDPFNAKYIHVAEMNGITGDIEPIALNIMCMSMQDIQYILKNSLLNCKIVNIRAASKDTENMIYNQLYQNLLRKNLPKDIKDFDYISSMRTIYINTKYNLATQKHAIIPIFIGYRLATELCVSMGNEISITIGTISPTIYQCTVAGIFKIGFYEYDKYQVFIPFHETINNSNEFTMVYINNPNKIDQYKQYMQRMYHVYIETWRETYQSINDMFKMHAIGIYMLIGLFILAGIIQSITNIFILISSKAKDFAILEDLGMSMKQKWLLIASYSACVNICNVIAGNLVGIAICVAYVIIRNILEKYHIYLIDQDAFWIMRFDPCLRISDLCIISIGSLAIMTTISIITTYCISCIPAFTWLKE